MGKLHHPIATFVLAVLVVIGIGVAVLAVQGPPKGTYFLDGCRYSDNASVQTYGPAGSQFAAEFPIQPTERHAVTGEFHLMYRVSEPRIGRGYGCIDGVTVEPTGDFPSLSFGTYNVGGIYSLARRHHWKVISKEAGLPRLTVWQFQPVHCYAYRCIGSLLATDGPTLWGSGRG